MGNGSFKSDQQTLKIEHEIKKEKAKLVDVVKMILLGSGESGKSTLVRQMKVLKAQGFSDQEREYFKDHISRNLAEWTVLFCKALAPEQPELQKYSEEIENWMSQLPASKIQFDKDVAQAISTALANLAAYSTTNPAMRDMPDSAWYMFSRRAEIMDQKYVPSDDDILRCRITTTGVHELQFSFGKHSFRVIDVGGQRGQRKKWIHQFENLQGMIFVTALSDYDRVLVEDGKTNRMFDSLTLFEALAFNPVFGKTSILVFFNKNDMFKEKVRHTCLSTCFDAYRCPDHADPYEYACEFVKNEFMKRKPAERSLYTHFTTATDPSNVNKVLQVTFDVILAQNVKSMGFS